MHRPRRFDTALMRAPAAAGAADPALLATLRAWCEGGAADTEPLRVARIATSAGLDAAACVLDGSHELARLGRWRGLLWRLQILWRAQTAGPHRPQHRPQHTPQNAAQSAPQGEPWDCGWWHEGALGPAGAFRPRRATLLMLHEPPPAAASALLAVLRTHSPAYARPLRVLVVSARPVAGAEALLPAVA